MLVNVWPGFHDFQHFVTLTLKLLSEGVYHLVFTSWLIATVGEIQTKTSATCM